MSDQLGPTEEDDIDWGGCICDPEVNVFDPDCPLFDGDEHEDE